MQDKIVAVKKEGAVAWVTMNRPGSLNSLTAELCAALKQALVQGADLMILSHVSNVFGSIAPLDEIAELLTAGRPSARAATCARYSNSLTMRRRANTYVPRERSRRR